MGACPIILVGRLAVWREREHTACPPPISAAAGVAAALAAAVCLRASFSVLTPNCHAFALLVCCAILLGPASSAPVVRLPPRVLISPRPVSSPNSPALEIWSSESAVGLLSCLAIRSPIGRAHSDCQYSFGVSSLAVGIVFSCCDRLLYGHLRRRFHLSRVRSSASFRCNDGKLLGGDPAVATYTSVPGRASFAHMSRDGPIRSSMSACWC